MALVEHFEQLLPGLADQITLYQITPRLSWRDLHFLASVSRSWRSAIASRQVYHARDFAKATQKLVIFHSYTDYMKETISVCSLSDGQCFELPPVPNVARGVLWSRARQSVALDGRVYLLGGELASDQDKVYVLDVAGQQRQWKQCASMTQPRQLPECAVFNGKIYVFGGSKGVAASNCGSEVYDPRENTWSPIRQYGALVECFYHVLPVGEELLVLCRQGQHPASQTSLLVYHPMRDEWRKEAKVFRYPPCVDMDFVADGKLYSICGSAIYVYDIENVSWVNLHSFSKYEDGGHYLSFVRVSSVIALDDELLAVVNWFSFISFTSTYYIAHSRGFKGPSREIFWERIHKCSSYPSRLKTIQV